MARTLKLLVQIPLAAILIWVGWGGVTAPASELPNSILKVPLFFFGVAWVVLVGVLLWRGRRS